MPITVTQDIVIKNIFVPNQNQRTAAQTVIAQLQYADIWRDAGTLRNVALMRVDMQGHIAGPPVRYNIQVQVNGIANNSTVAHADISSLIASTNPQNQQGALSKVISALNLSLDTGHSFIVTGNNP